MLNPINKINNSPVFFHTNPKKQQEIHFSKIESTSFWQLPAQKLGIFRIFSKQNQSNSSERRISPESFFINMKGYKRDFDWAKEMAEVAEKTSKKISNKEDFYSVLNYVIASIDKFSTTSHFGKPKKYFGTYFLIKDGKRGSEYLPKYKEKMLKIKGPISPRSNKKYKRANTAMVYKYRNDYCAVVYGHNRFKNTINLDLCMNAYNELLSKENPGEREILETCAVIQWLFYQECPFCRGNDSIANVLTKAIMHSYNMEISPLKEGCSLDFEAFYRDLDDYIKNYPNFFEKYPGIL